MNLSTASRTFQMLSRIFDTKTSTESFLPPTGEKTSLPLRPPQHLFPRATPESYGISSDHIRCFLEELGRGDDLYMQNVLILRHGNLLCGAAYGAQRLDAAKYTFSACKSVTSLAIGLLVADGVLHLRDTVAELFDVPSHIHRRLKNLTVEDLLTMQSGIQFSEAQTTTESDWLQGIFNESLSAEPGTVFHYNSLNTYLLAAIIQRVSGMGVQEFLEKRLFLPMGITDILWERCPQGIEKGGWGLYIRPEDIAKLGQLILNRGVWNHQQLLSPEYIHAATTPHATPPSETGEFDYGYQIWVGRKERTFLFNGMLGQNILGYWDSGILIVTNAGADTDYQEGRFFEIVNRYFGGTFPDTLPENPSAQKRLKHCVQNLSYYNRKPLSLDQSANIFLNRNFVTDDPHAAPVGLLPLLLQALHNNYTKGVSSVAISTRGNLPELIYREQDAIYRLPIGLGVPLVTELSFHGDHYHIAAHGRFTHDEEERPVFYIRLDFLETPCVRILKLILNGDGLLLRQTETPGVPYLYGKLRMAAQNPLYKPLLLMGIGGSDEDFLRYKTLSILSPEIPMTAEN